MANNRKRITAPIALLILLGCAQVIKAEPHETILFSGLPNERVDIVIMGCRTTSSPVHNVSPAHL
jgi:hypothetical protein